MGLFNPRILDTSICDVIAKLSDLQKADVLLHALHHVPIKGCRMVIENAVQTLLQVPNLPSENVARALLLRANGRFAAGYHMSAHHDLHSASIADPENEDIRVEATIRSQQASTPFYTSGFDLVPQDVNGPPNVPEEIWMQIALYLPRRDLRSLLLVPNALSSIASQLLFCEIDLHLTQGAIMDTGELLGTFGKSVWGAVDQSTVAWHNRRSADLLARILVDSHFASRIRTLNILAVPSDAEQHLEFKAGMLVNALAKLFNLCNVHCAGSKWLIVHVLQSVHAYNPRLQRLSIVLAGPDFDIEVPVFKHITHFSIRWTGGNDSSVRTFLDQSRDGLRCISLRSLGSRFPTQVISIRYLTRFDFSGHFLEEAFSEILENGYQLESLMLSGSFQSPSSSSIRQHRNALPFLRHFSLTILAVATHTSDPDFCSAICDFVRERTQLQTYHLFVTETSASRVGFDTSGSAWAILPTLLGLRNLSITFPKDLPPALAGWLIPRTVHALTLEFWRTDKRDAKGIIVELRKGIIPHQLYYVCISDIRIRSPRSIVEELQAIPHVRVARVNWTIWTVTRSGEGLLEATEQWPERRVQYHEAGWLKSLGCEDAIWKGVDE